MKNTRGGVRLRDWLRDERRTQEWIAEQIESNQSNVSRWLLGRTPPLSAALAIEKVTGIPAADWLDPSDESSPSLAEQDIQDAEDSSLHGRQTAS